MRGGDASDGDEGGVRWQLREPPSGGGAGPALTEMARPAELLPARTSRGRVAFAKGHPPLRGTAARGQPPRSWRRRAERCEECPSWMVWMGSLGDVSTCLALPQLHRADHLVAQKAAKKGAEPWPCRSNLLSAGLKAFLEGLAFQTGPGRTEQIGEVHTERTPLQEPRTHLPQLSPRPHAQDRSQTPPLPSYRTRPTVLKRTPAKVGSSFRILRYCSLAWAAET